MKTCKGCTYYRAGFYCFHPQVTTRRLDNGKLEGGIADYVRISGGCGTNRKWYVPTLFAHFLHTLGWTR